MHTWMTHDRCINKLAFENGDIHGWDDGDIQGKVLSMQQYLVLKLVKLGRGGGESIVLHMFSTVKQSLLSFVGE